MGVTGLWTVVQPCARPIKIETLNKKRLAVDASIWIYQFLKAVRDKEGNALRNSHVVGFFRRICKLLFIGIKPVFVFDGGAPALKRQTISGRKQRREGRREDATRTAAKLLALQMQRLAEEDEANRKRAAQGGRVDDEEEEVGDNIVYVDELQMTQKERQQNRKFRKKDQYHLPELDGSLADMAPNDPRIMSLEELEAYARQFDTGEDINVYDFSKIDFDSPFFTSLPPSDRYNILNAARLRSRLRMGHSKEQLDAMFPDRMAFSKFQIERVTERNELTQRLMNINGMNDDGMFSTTGAGRVAGEKGREYVLVRNDGVEGGWALGVVGGNDEGSTESKPIDVDKPEKNEDDDEDWDEDEDFEDVPIEGLNRLPKTLLSANSAAASSVSRSRTNRSSRRRPGQRRPARKSAKPVEDDPDSLFVADVVDEVDNDDLFGDSDVDMASDEDELQRAIAMSLEQESGEAAEEDKEDWLDKFEQKRADEDRPLPRGRGLAIAHIVNSRAGKVVPAARSPSPTILLDGHPAQRTELTKPTAFGNAEDESDSDDMDFQSALAESRKSKHQSTRNITRPDPPAPSARTKPSTVAKSSAFSGPLPFEKLDLGTSLLGKKKMQKIQEDNAGGFERTDTDLSKKKAEPLPPWFDGNNLDTGLAAQKKIEQQDREKARKYQDTNYRFDELPTLRRAVPEVVDLEAEEENDRKAPDIIQVDSSDDEILPTQMNAVEPKEPTMGDIADNVRADPPAPEPAPVTAVPPIIRSEDKDMVSKDHSLQKQDIQNTAESTTAPEQDEAPLDWEDSDAEDKATQSKTTEPLAPRQASKSSSPEFEDVEMTEQPAVAHAESTTPPKIDQATPLPESNAKAPSPAPASGLADQNVPAEAGQEDEFGYYTDSEDEEIMRTLAAEAEEHARFASTLNHKTQQQNIDDYERELKALRSQQKKDRRDADEVTQVMIQECQQLLQLFGLPYMTAPMEAEAQCAELVKLGLVDGIVTDDSDCFLFGGTRIYKNMFNQAKFVECYLASDLEKEFDLSRQKLIGIAHLLGSDYTEGLPGVGPVTALEILSEFATLDDFKSWFENIQMNPRADKTAEPSAFRRKFRKAQASKLFLPPSFPDPRVDAAYLQPDTDADPSAFQWGVPNLAALRAFLMATIGWSEERTDEVLVPVIRDMNRRGDEGTQSNITQFFEGGTAGAGPLAARKKGGAGSKRMGSALERLADKAKRKRRGGDEVADVVAETEMDGGGGDMGDAGEGVVIEKDKPVRKKRAATRVKKGANSKTAAVDEDE